MKGLLVTVDGKVSVREYGEPLYKTIGEDVGGYIEIVHPEMLFAPYVMVVNEEGLLQDLRLNLLGSKLYGTPRHGYAIVGNVVFMKEGINEDGEPDILGLDGGDIEFLRRLCLRHVPLLEMVGV